jgi:hypothetical protein
VPSRNYILTEDKNNSSPSRSNSISPQRRLKTHENIIDENDNNSLPEDWDNNEEIEQD